MARYENTQTFLLRDFRPLGLLEITLFEQRYEVVSLCVEFFPADVAHEPCEYFDLAVDRDI